MSDRLSGVFRRVAEGRREYAASLEGESNPVLREQYAALMAEASAFESAARIAEGDTGPLYGLLPSWRWTDEMTDRLT